MELDEAARKQLEGLGQFIREHREQAKLSLREFEKRTGVSNGYLSQLERGLHAPSVRVLRGIAAALNVSAESLLSQAGILNGTPSGDVLSVEDAIRSDSQMTDHQKAALLAIYRSYVGETSSASSPGHPSSPPADRPSIAQSPRIQRTDVPSRESPTSS